MSCFIKTEAGRKIGLGHLTRCISIYQAFLARGVRPKFIVNEGVKSTLFYTKNRITTFDDKECIFTNDDILVIDSYLTPVDFYKQMFKMVKLLVSIDDFNRLDYPGGVVVNTAVYAEDLPYVSRQNIKYILGAKYAPLRKSFWKVNIKKVRKQIQDVLITFGGFHDDFAKYMVSFISKNFKFNCHVVLSNDDKCAQPKGVFFYNNITDKKMKELMYLADVCISAGGQTTYELASCGVPAIGLCFARNQLANLNGAEKAGYSRFAGWYNRGNICTKVGKILESLDYKNRISMSRTGQRVVDGRGAKRLVSKILEYAKN